MTIRTVINQTNRTVKRHVTCSANEITALGTVNAGENHVHLLSHDGGAGAAWFYPGYEHIPTGYTQSGTVPV